MKFRVDADSDIKSRDFFETPGKITERIIKVFEVLQRVARLFEMYM